MLQKPKPDLSTNSEEDDKSDKDYRPHGIAAKTAAGGYTRKNKKERAQKQVSGSGGRLAVSGSVYRSRVFVNFTLILCDVLKIELFSL